MDIQGKVVLITGGGTGLGRVIARHLAQAGMHVAVGYSRSGRDAFSKAGTIHLTKCLAAALGPDIRVNAVAPGLMETRWNDTFSAVYIQAAKQQATLKQATRLEDVAAAYVMLARNESITGQIITVDSGLTL